ncbi:hypothetical protein JM654_11705 [Microbacterium oxydans]|nr:hypothetical protein [Microbacterium oxydans]
MCHIGAGGARAVRRDRSSTRHEPGERDPHHARILEVMTVRARLSIDEVARRSGALPDRVRSVLGLLHLEGDVALDSAGWHRAAPPRR